ncbi:MAG: NTP transferase domain-containing protein [Firmicutes bacterium]|nr:NTP transferase domain-containing protein [Bacillota bacterium]
MFDAVILAGGGKTEPLTEQEGVFNKAFIEIHGRPMISYVINGLSGSPSIGKIVAVGPEKELRELLTAGYEFTPVPEEGSLLDNVAAGLRGLEGDRLCLVLTGDIPLIERVAIEGLLALCAPFDGDFYYPILKRERCQERFPQMKRTYVRLREGYFTGGNVALLRPDWFTRCRPRLDLFVTYRKKPLKLFRILPVSFIYKFLLNRLTVTDLEDYLAGMMQASVHAVPCSFVEIGTDVDKSSDLEIVRHVLKQKEK